MTAPTMTYTDDKEYARELRRRLAEFADSSFSPDLGVAYHKGEPKNKISLPDGMALSKAAEQLQQAATAEREMQVYNRTFKFRPWDGAAALVRVMQKHFGVTGRGKAIQSMFGSIPPQQIDVEVAYGQTIQVPWGHIEFSFLEGTIMLGSTMDSEYGLLFTIAVECPKRYGPSVHGFFNLIQSELEENSIYKGKAIRESLNPNEPPRFLDLQVDPHLQFNDDVLGALQTSVWGVIEHTAFLRDMEVKTDPKVLLHGPYGTGKSETGRLTAKVANTNGWTFIAFNSGKSSVEDLERTLKTARLLAPCVVFVEDINIYVEQSQDERTQTRILEMFDGISAKGAEVMVLMTSNKPAVFSKGMLRAGRINRMIEVGPLDKDATERLIRSVCGHQLGEVDFEKVWEAMDGFEPSFVRQTFNDARQAAAIRSATQLKREGRYTPEAARDFKLETTDFVNAANLMRPQHEQHSQASDSQKQVTLDMLFRNTVKGVLTDDLHMEWNGDTIEVVEVEEASK